MTDERYKVRYEDDLVRVSPASDEAVVFVLNWGYLSYPKCRWEALVTDQRTEWMWQECCDAFGWSYDYDDVAAALDAIVADGVGG
jgi:hypothetical protein